MGLRKCSVALTLETNYAATNDAKTVWHNLKNNITGFKINNFSTIMFIFTKINFHFLLLSEANNSECSIVVYNRFVRGAFL